MLGIGLVLALAHFTFCHTSSPRSPHFTHNPLIHLSVFFNVVVGCLPLMSQQPSYAGCDFSARYISLLYYDVSVRLSVRLHVSVTEVHWRIIANLGFKLRSKFIAHCGRGEG